VQGCFTEPEEVSAAIDAGATGALIDLGLVVSGPGFAKRANDWLVSQKVSLESVHDRSSESTPVFRTSWFWAMMLGIGMLIGGFLALGIASTRVVLPYDEVFYGLSRSQIEQFNPRLIQFMVHDRISLAGVMLAIAGLYLGLGYGGMKQGLVWARTAVLISAGFGFASFFLFLGFGYFDPFHGFVTAIMFQLYLQCLINPLCRTECCVSPEPRETRAWRRGQWGQFLLVIHGGGTLGGRSGDLRCGMLGGLYHNGPRILGRLKTGNCRFV
jgi:dihydroorotate dehydrogenase